MVLDAIESKLYRVRPVYTQKETSESISFGTY